MQLCSIFTPRDSKWKGAFASFRAGCDHTAATALACRGGQSKVPHVPQGAQKGFSRTAQEGCAGSCAGSARHRSRGAQQGSCAAGASGELLPGAQRGSAPRCACIGERAVQREAAFSRSFVKAGNNLFSFFNSTIPHFGFIKHL